MQCAQRPLLRGAYDVKPVLDLSSQVPDEISKTPLPRLDCPDGRLLLLPGCPSLEHDDLRQLNPVALKVDTGRRGGTRKRTSRCPSVAHEPLVFDVRYLRQICVWQV